MFYVVLWDTLFMKDALYEMNEKIQLCLDSMSGIVFEFN